MMSPDSFLELGAPFLSQWGADEERVERALWELRREAYQQRQFVGSLRAAKMRTRDGVFGQFAALLQFPAYFGENWNAFRDCIADLDWLNANGCLLVILDADQLLADGEPDEFDVLLDSLRDAGALMAEAKSPDRPKAFHVALHVHPHRTTELISRIGTRAIHSIGP